MLDKIYTWWHSYTRRTRKRWYIGTVYALLFGSLSFWAINTYIIVHPTCFDGVRNGSELGVDCGGACQNLCLFQQVERIRIIEKRVIETLPGFYDVFGVVENPNRTAGIEDLRYEFNIIAEDGTIMKTISGRTFLLPRSEKYIVEPAVQLPQPPARIDLIFKPLQWRDLENYIDPQIFARNKELRASQPGEREEMSVTALVQNNSDIDFQDIAVTVVVKERVTDTVVAVNRTDLQTLAAGTERRFTTVWPFTFRVVDPHVIVQTETNVFDNDNFIRERGLNISDPFSISR